MNKKVLDASIEELSDIQKKHLSYLGNSDEEWYSQSPITDTANGCEYVIHNLNGSIAIMNCNEVQEYIKQLNTKLKDGKVKHLSIIIDGDFVDIAYDYVVPGRPFERIRRITGYLVGTLDRFNDAKRSEVEDRVKHDTTYSPTIMRI